MSTTDDQTPIQSDDQTPDPADDAEETPSGKRVERQARQEAVTRAEQAEVRLTAFQRREVARLASDYLAEGADVLQPLLGGSDLSALLDADGVPDPELVAAAAQTMAEKRPGLAVARRPPRAGSPDGGARPPLPRARGWADVLRARQ